MRQTRRYSFRSFENQCPWLAEAVLHRLFPLDYPVYWCFGLCSWGLRMSRTPAWREHCRRAHTVHFMVPKHDDLPSRKKLMLDTGRCYVLMTSSMESHLPFVRITGTSCFITTKVHAKSCNENSIFSITITWSNMSRAKTTSQQTLYSELPHMSKDGCDPQGYSCFPFCFIFSKAHGTDRHW